MHVTLDNKEIHQALTEYVSKEGFMVEGKDVTIVLTNKRKGAGSTAEITISEPDADTPTAEGDDSGLFGDK